MRCIAGLCVVWTLLAAGSLRAQVLPGAGARGPAASAVRGSIRGVVLNENGQPVAAAAIAVKSARDSALVGGALTTADGRFRISGLAAGRYLVRVSQLGYKPLSPAAVAVSDASANVDLGQLRLELAPVQVQGVEAVAARAPMVAAADRNIYNVKAMPVASTGTAVDVLRTVPELEVDQNGKVTMHGNQSVAIHFNGRPAPIRGEALQTYLQQFPANRIERIEVIANPSAKYDPEGMGGIVNIALKDNADLGFSGTLTGIASTRGQNGVMPRVAYQKGRLTFFGGATIMFIRQAANSHDLRENFLTDPVSYLDLTSASRYRYTYGYGDATAEYKLSKTFTAWSSLNANPNKLHSDVDMDYLWLDSAQVPTERSGRVTGTDGTTSMTAFTTGLRRQIRPQQNEWSVELRRSVRANDNDGRWTQQPLNLDGGIVLPATLTLNNQGTDFSEWRLQADLTRPLGKTGRLEAGIQGTRRRDGNDNTMQMFPTEASPDPLLTTVTGYDRPEDIAAAYATVGRPFGKLSLQAGLRAEVANTSFEVKRTGESFDNDYRNLFPSGNAMLNLGKGRTVRLSYSKRLERPYASMLNPDVPSSDPLNRNIGNPYLKPRYTHSISANLMWIRTASTYMIGPYFRRTTNDWANVKTVDTLGVSTVMYQNVNAVNSVGINATVSKRQTKRVGGYLNASLFSNHYSAASLGEGAYAGSHLRYSLMSNAQIKASKNLDGQLLVMWQPAQDLPNGRMSGLFISYAGFRQKLGRAAWANAMVMDPFKLLHYTVTTRNGSHVQTSRSNYRLRALTLNVTYSFGRAPQSQRPQRAPDDQAQQGQPSQQPERQVR